MTEVSAPTGIMTSPTPVLATVVAVPAGGDVELQQQKSAGGAVVMISPVHAHNNRIDDGKGLGIAMFVLLLVEFLFSFIFPPVSFVCLIATIVISSILTCGCCCDYELKPNVKMYAKATLASLLLMFLIAIVGSAATAFAVMSDHSNREGADVSFVLIQALCVILNIMALVFSGLFTWGRGYGRQEPIGAMVI